jgi:apolipoprotein N-acyltransferase
LCSTRWAALLALAGGLSGVVAFPRFGIWPAAAISVALLSLAVDGRRSRTGAWLGYLYGAAFLVPLLSWTGIYVGPAPWLILALAFAAFFALLGALLPLLATLRGYPLWVGAAWVLQEALRDRLPFGGFPWGRLAFSQAVSPLRWFAALGGAPLLTFVVAVAGAGLATAVRALRPVIAAQRPHGRVLAGGLAVAVAVPLVGLLLGEALSTPPAHDGRTERIAVIQGGLPDLKLQFESRAEQVLDNHVRQTMKLAERIKAGTTPRPDLVLWPENASDVDPFRDPGAYRKIDTAVRAVGAPVLVGAILQGPGPTHRRNVGILWSPTTGPGAQYVKRHPVPFAEYIPLRGLAEWVSSDAKTVTQDMVAGHGNGLLRGGGVPIGDVICFEVAYDDLVHSSVAAGAQLLVVQTNNATFGHTAETYQQLAMSRLRAVEAGRTVVQVATTGKSAVIDPNGGLQAESGTLFAPAIITRTVAIRSAQTLATRVGAWPEYLIGAAALVGAAIAIVRRRRAAPERQRPVTEQSEHRAVVPQ